MIQEGFILFGFGVGVVALAFGLHVLIMYLGSVIQHRSESCTVAKSAIDEDE